MMLQQRIINEVQQIPESQLIELYDLIHRFRLKSVKEIIASRQPGLLKGQLGDAFFEPLPEDELRNWE